MEDMVRQSHSSAKQIIIGNVTQLVERRQVKGQSHESQKNIDDVGLFIIVSAGFF